MHGIDEGTWLAFLDGEPSAEVERHLVTCAECAETVSQFRTWQAALRTEGSRVRNAAGIGEERIEQMLDECLGQLSAARAWTPQQATLLLRSLLEPFCGAGAAQAITELTMSRSSDWRAFVGQLSENAESICGSAVGRLVGRAGMSLSVENA